MELKIIEEKENALFNRKEVKVALTNETIPSKMEAAELLSKKFSTDAENIKIKKVESKFGSRNFVIEANVYDSKENKEKTEVKTKQELEAEKKAREEAAKAAAAEKAKAEAEKAEAEAQKEESKEENKEATQ